MPKATRAAAELKARLNVDATLIPGDRGEFTVWVDGRKVAGKRGDDYPSDREIVDSVRAALAA